MIMLSLQCSRVDIAHLSLYNLSVIHKKKYFDSEMHLMSYINDNWELLQLGEVKTHLTTWGWRDRRGRWGVTIIKIIPL